MNKFLTALFLMPCFSLFAQITFKPGYYIDNSGTKTECLIEDIGWLNSPTGLDYKLNESDSKKHLDLADITAFETEGYKFERYTVKIERSRTNTDDLDEKPDPEYTTETLFLRQLVEGTIVLYSYKSVNVEKFFFKRDTDKAPQLLLYKRYKDGRDFKENKRYINQLAYVFAITDKQDALSKLRYDEDALKGFFIKNNGGGNDSKEDVKTVDKTVNQSKSDFSLRVTGAVYMTTLKTEVLINEYFSDRYEFSQKPVFGIGIEAEYILPFNHNKWALFANPEYYQYKKEEIKPFYPGSADKETWAVNLNYVAIPMGLRYYMHLSPKSRLHINAAYITGFRAGKATISADNATYNTYLQGNWMVGAGYSYNKLFYIEFRANSIRHFNTRNISWADYSSYGIVLSYRIL